MDNLLKKLKNFIKKIKDNNLYIYILYDLI